MLSRGLRVLPSVAGVRGLANHSDAELLAAYDRLFPTNAVPNLTRSLVDGASGAWLDLHDGRKVLDCAAGIGATNTGHAHPKVVAAAANQLASGIHLQQNHVWQRPVAELLLKLDDITPPELNKFFFNLSGSEAVESSLKLARQATGKPNIISLQGAYHGRTYGAMSVTSSKVFYVQGFGAGLGGVHRAPFPYCHKCVANPAGGTPPACCGSPLKQLEMLFKTQSHPTDTAALIIEPVLGEGGYVVPPKEYMKDVRALCDEHDVLMIADEVQSGFGRTGKWFAIDHFDIVPDILVMAKGIASGMPLSGIAAKGHLFEGTPAGSFGGTYGPNSGSAAAAVATIEVFEEENILENCVVRGEQLMEGLESLRTRFAPHIKDVRGLGLMVGIEFDDADAGVAGRVSAACLDEDLLLLTTGPYEVVRFIPPLTITEAELDTALARFGAALEAVFGGK